MPTFGQHSIEQLATCDPRLQAVFNEVIKYWDCTVLEGHRGQAAQDAAFATGKSQKRWPNGNHNSMPSRAVDVAPFPVDWNDTRRMLYFAGFVMGVAWKMGVQLRYGGDWNRDTQVKDNSFQDLVHFEIVA